MKIEILDEPELEFAGGQRHIDIRFGLMHAGPLDVGNPRTRAISVGIVGTTETTEGITRWLERCRDEIPGKQSPYPNLFPMFPGFRSDTAFRSTLTLDNRTQATVARRDLDPLAKSVRSNQVIESAVDLFFEQMRHVVEKSRPDVLICAPPAELWDAVKGDSVVTDDTGNAEDSRERSRPYRIEFHDLLKARALALHVPVQLIWPQTYDTSKRRRQKRRPQRLKDQQDEATRAWNLHTALYYKAGGIPWRLVRDPSQYTVCCVGISFYRTLEGDRIFTSMAQVFNERGDGVVVRGAQASRSKEDRQPHVSAIDAEALLSHALNTYRREHGTLPARIVLHKTSRYTAEERSGFQAAATAASMQQIDFLSLGDSFIRLYREGEYPPLRGTFLSLDDRSHVLYTRGSIDFFRTYPGLYVPLPLHMRCEETDQTPRYLAEEILALTKMNWNSTQFDGRDPITIRAAEKVGGILRYVSESSHVEPSYGYYM